MTKDTTRQRNIRVELDGGWRYGGLVLSENVEFITILDSKSTRRITFRRSQILRMEEDDV